MIIGTHFLLYSKDADADRAFFRDVLQFPCVDAGEGWLIFAMSPAEAGIHPLEGKPSDVRTEQGLLSGELYLMCDDLNAVIAALKGKNVQCTDIHAVPWGITTTVPLPSGGAIGLYQPRHKTALNLTLK
jgi:hypothetical protein